jgi:hypothetical protein
VVALPVPLIATKSTVHAEAAVAAAADQPTDQVMDMPVTVAVAVQAAAAAVIAITVAVMAAGMAIRPATPLARIAAAMGAGYTLIRPDAAAAVMVTIPMAITMAAGVSSVGFSKGKQRGMCTV